MRDPLIPTDALRRAMVVVVAVIVMAGILAVVWVPSAQAQAQAQAQSRASSPAPKPPGSTGTLPLTARMILWPMWMAPSWDPDERMPPLLELSFGMQRRWFELSFAVGIASRRMLEPKGTYYGLAVSVGMYSLRRHRVRLRHGFTFGLLGTAILERHPPTIQGTPLPMARIQLLDILVRLGHRWWLEISPLTAGFPSLYEASLGIRYEFDDPTPHRPPPAGRSQPRDGRPRPFLSLEQGMVWWHHYQPPVVSLTFGRVGFRYRWFETALAFGSPAWAAWRTRGLYELAVDLSFYSIRRSRLRLRHQIRLGLLFHNPPFELHTWSAVVIHADFCILSFPLGRGFWVELHPVTISIAPRDQLSSSLALRYEL